MVTEMLSFKIFVGGGRGELIRGTSRYYGRYEESNLYPLNLLIESTYYLTIKVGLKFKLIE
jgi:hypothetical protein